MARARASKDRSPCSCVLSRAWSEEEGLRQPVLRAQWDRALRRPILERCANTLSSKDPHIASSRTSACQDTYMTTSRAARRLDVMLSDCQIRAVDHKSRPHHCSSMFCWNTDARYPRDSRLNKSRRCSCKLTQELVTWRDQTPT